ncbi:hypothetical protein A2799_01830 [Candidatus Roizmanbacteria bacterium RIFCSPHIGHO2_01_FULL_39_24]|uniref:2-oxoglutarate dehydrogenase n=1 Tax=Candidatus Roizmanbacteria bacterium RIFCSPHIGHO2_01_FULL_39_24 TaxID=1802032 RepID=A0A1F7GFX3_9BACT|nr:MAG: hypothetical protein A2799_01830 [Candidatus Roizmanbacteria bacterium RIFCSPHIGHO2_01_FULL_39_24]OGK49597.1 MAG: hypothetical protein A3A56_03385 [Candidatus Roizmanbacteria bacterium RIFCSPLOWO2_01_FULL_40_32]
MKKFIKDNGVFIAWVVSIFSLTGSLFFSEILKLPPCILCWYQRILMYPLVLIIGVGIVRKDKGLPLYVLPFSILGSAVALFHYLLQRGIIPDSVAPCTQGISCTSKLIEYYGFITIPFMSLVSFVIISLCMIILLRSKSTQ